MNPKVFWVCINTTLERSAESTQPRCLPAPVVQIHSPGIRNASRLLISQAASHDTDKSRPSHYASRRFLISQVQCLLICLLILRAAFSFLKPRSHLASRLLSWQAAFSVGKPRSHLASRVLMWQAAFSMTQAAWNIVSA